MSYLVLARKWRPKFFDDVVGQEHVARTLENSIEQDRVHHAYLFCGARGVGKTSTARILAKCLNCEAGGDDPVPRPCNECKSCEDITEGQSVDVYEIDGASNRGINEIRELREGVRYAPSQGRFKIYIIDEVHMLTTEAFNALLKTLEEPPDHAYFIFATTEPQKIPITILSRCQRFDFKRISQDDIVGHLASICEKEGLEVETEALQLIARQADGAMRDALSLLDQVIGFAGDQIDEEEVANILGVANREHLFEISRAVLGRDAQEALSALDVVDRYGYDLQQFASELVTHLRDLTVCAAADEPARVTDLTASELEEAQSQLAEMEVAGQRRRQLLHRYFSVMAEGARKMTRSPYPKLIFEMTLVRLTDLEPLVELDLLVDRLEALEGEFDGEMPADMGPPPERAPSPNEAPATDTADEGRSRPREASADGGAQTSEDRASDEESDDDSEDDQADAGEADWPDPPISEAEASPSPEPEPAATDEMSGPEPEPDEPAPGPETDVEDPGDAEGRWELIVQYLCDKRGTTGVKFEWAHPRSFENGRIALGCGEEHYSFFQRDDHMQEIEEAASALFGGDWSASITPWDDDESEDAETLADRREAEYRERKRNLREDVENNPVVQEARSLFDLDDEDVRIDVELDE